jgi:putative tryptophan/tyrosine transport system permease protein
MSFLVSAWTVGLILAMLSLSAYVSYKVFRFPDITVDGTFTLGAAVSLSLLVNAGKLPAEYAFLKPIVTNPIGATLAATLAGALAGATTGLLHAYFKLEGLLAGILVMTGLYSINLLVMGNKSTVFTPSDGSVKTLMHYAHSYGEFLGLGKPEEKIEFFGRWSVTSQDLGVLAAVATIATVLGFGMYLFFKTNIGTAMRATGDNPQMIRALGVNTGGMVILGLAMSNGLAALSGALFAQLGQNGNADAQMGVGMVVTGLASVILGEALIGSAGVGLGLLGAIAGSVLFRLMIAIALLCNLDQNYLKLVTAVFVFAALVLPGMWPQIKAWYGRKFGVGRGAAQNAREKAANA